MTPEQRIRIQVDDQYGTVALLLDPAEDAMSPGQRSRLAALAARAVRKLAPLVGSEEQARWILLAAVTRLHADQLAYERVAQHRSVSPVRGRRAAAPAPPAPRPVPELLTLF